MEKVSDIWRLFGLRQARWHPERHTYQPFNSKHAFSSSSFDISYYYFFSLGSMIWWPLTCIRYFLMHKAVVSFNPLAFQSLKEQLDILWNMPVFFLAGTKVKWELILYLSVKHAATAGTGQWQFTFQFHLRTSSQWILNPASNMWLKCRLLCFLAKSNLAFLFLSVTSRLHLVVQ